MRRNWGEEEKMQRNHRESGLRQESKSGKSQPQKNNAYMERTQNSTRTKKQGTREG